MSVDPVRSESGGGNLASLIVAELAALAGDAQTLQTRLKTGDVVAAIVQPSNGLTDVLTIDGLRVAAELPPSLVPGEIIAVKVTGFTGDRINLQIIPAAVALGPDVPGEAAAQRVAGFATPPADRPFPSSLPADRTPPATLPADRTAPATFPADRTAPPPALTDRTLAVRSMFGSQAMPRPSMPVRTHTGTPIEARIATARAAEPASSVLGVRAGATPPGSPIAPRPLIAARSIVSTHSPTAAPRAVPDAGRGTSPFSDPATLLRALRLPVNGATVAAARVALDAPQKMPQALARVERALTGLADSRAATVRALVGFVGRLEPRSPVFAAQIAAFVDHIVTGHEVKLVQLLAAQREPVPSVGAADDGTDRLADGDSDTAAQTARVPSVRPPQSDAIHAERIVVRQAALDYDLKSKLFALAADVTAPQSLAPKDGELQAALTGALTAVTALQLRAATALANNPDGIAFALPITLPSGFAQARVRIDRDAPQRAVALDGDNFHIAFVLETQHLGTIALDLVTVGRTVTVGVQTESARAQRIFADALAQLAQRLESLRYRVAKAAAVIAPPASPVSVAPLVAQAADGARQVDVDA